jgi:hypothetical protein
MATIVVIDQIKDGMITAEPVINNFGFTLIPAGTTLLEKHKKILKTWNVLTVSIKSDEQEDDLEISEELKLLASERLNKRMKWSPRNAHEINLYQAAIIRIAGMITKNMKESDHGND